MRVGTIAGTSAFCARDFCTTRSGKCTALIWRSFPRSHRSNRMKPRHMSRPSKKVAAGQDGVAQVAFHVSLRGCLPHHASRGLLRCLAQAVEVGHGIKRARLTRSALACARFSSRRLRRAARLCSEFTGGTPRGLQCGSGSRLRYGHETRRSHGAPRHASSIRPPSRGAYLRAHARRSRLPSSSRSAFGPKFTRSGNKGIRGGGEPRRSSPSCSWHCRCC